MTPQSILDFGARHMLTQNQRCIEDSRCLCQLGTLRCVMASFAVESDVTRYGSNNASIPSIRLYKWPYETDIFNDLIHIHDGNNQPESWPDKLAELAFNYQLQPFSPSDLSGRRGRENPLAVWYTNPAERQELLAAHAAEGTSNLLEDYCKQFPIDA